MAFKIVICLCLILINGIFGKNIRLFGGFQSEISQFPYLASIRIHQENKFLVAATIVSKWNVVTTAHRVFPYKDNFEELRVYTGSSSSTETNETFKLQHVTIHPTFRMGNPLQHNLSVIKLQRSIVFNEFQDKIPLSTRTYASGHEAWVTGWGIMNPTPSFSTQLRKAKVHTLHYTECRRRVPFYITENLFCTYQARGIGVCPGDTGGPVVVDDTLFGIVLFSGQQRGTNAPDIHLNVYHYYNFIALLIED